MRALVLTLAGLSALGAAAVIGSPTGSNATYSPCESPGLCGANATNR